MLGWSMESNVVEFTKLIRRFLRFLKLAESWLIRIGKRYDSLSE
jgi:hypothetical protein